MKKLLLTILFTVFTCMSVFAAAPEAHADGTLFRGAAQIFDNVEVSPLVAQPGDNVAAPGGSTDSAALMAFLMLVLILLIVILDVAGKEVKNRGLKLCLNFMFGILAVPAWPATLIYIIVRIALWLLGKRKKK